MTVSIDGTSDIAQTTFDVEGGDPPPPPPPGGEALFNNKCIMCHGEYGAGGYAHRSIKGARASRIRNAMNKWPEMGFLSYLSDAELDNIETYLGSVPRGDKLPRHGDFVNGELQFRQSCTYCHTFEGTPIEPPRPGPDLVGISTAFSDTWLGAWIDYPKEMVAAHAIDPETLADYPYVMPDLGHPPVDVWDIVDFLVRQEDIGPVVDSTPVFDTDTDPRFDISKQVYFNNCAGCHGLYRFGATGPDIGAARSQDIGTDGLGAILRYGTPKGMGNFGQTGILSDEEITNLAAYLQLPPPDAPELPWEDIVTSWDLIVPVDERPTEPPLRNGEPINWQNYTGVILRDAGQVAIFDGDTNEEIVRLSTGFAVHILRSSSSGRYFYAIGRDGLVTMIDLWTLVPTIVANVKGCHDARSVEASKYPGYEDVYIIEGCYWPPQYVVYDGLTLEPKQLVDLPMVDIDGATLIENRVASIVASHNGPVWVVSLKEAGIVGIVDYSDPEFPIVSEIHVAKFLHDGGFDHTGNYFLVAANASNKMVVIDLKNQTLAAEIVTGAVPHPGRGVNWIDPVYGWVNATPHIGEGKVTVYDADPTNNTNPDAPPWQIVREITLPSSGSLFIKSHPASPWVLVDMTLSATGFEKDICAISKETGALANNLAVSVDPDGDGCFTVATNGKAVHMEFNMDGSEVWVSDWDPDGAVIVLDSTTLEEIRRFTGLPTPTGKFNVYNTAHDIY